MKQAEKITGIVLTNKELSELANRAIENYRANVSKETGGNISRAKAVVAILERFNNAQR
jgi:hypothetical protein